MIRSSLPLIFFATVVLHTTVLQAETIVMPPPECLSVGKATYDPDYPWLAGKKPNSVPPFHPMTMAALRSLSDDMAAQGKHLILAPMLPPAAFTPKAIAWANDITPETMLATHTKLVEYLVENGIDTVDLAKAYQERGMGFAYQRQTDHHWTAKGAIFAGQIVAEAIAPRSDLAEDQWKDDFSSFPQEPNRYTPPIFRESLVPSCDLNDYYIEDVSILFPPINTSSQSTGDALFGDLATPLTAVLGSSYSARDAGEVFPNAIQYYSKTQVIRYWVGGGGPSTSWHQFLQDGGVENPSIDAVVWEIPNTNNDTTLGAAIFANGSRAGNCDENDLFFARRTITFEPDKWVEFPEFIGLVNRLSVAASQQPKFKFEFEMSDGSRVSADTLLNGRFERSEDFVWNFALPSEIPSDEGMQSVYAMRLSLAGHNNYEMTEPVTLDVATCGSL